MVYIINSSTKGGYHHHQLYKLLLVHPTVGQRLLQAERQDGVDHHSLQRRRQLVLQQASHHLEGVIDVHPSDERVGQRRRQGQDDHLLQADERSREDLVVPVGPLLDRGQHLLLEGPRDLVVPLEPMVLRRSPQQLMVQGRGCMTVGKVAQG